MMRKRDSRVLNIGTWIVGLNITFASQLVMNMKSMMGFQVRKLKNRKRDNCAKCVRPFTKRICMLNVFKEINGGKWNKIMTKTGTAKNALSHFKYI